MIKDKKAYIDKYLLINRALEDQTNQEKLRLLKEVRISALAIGTLRTSEDKSYQGMPSMERTVKYLGEILKATPYSEEDKRLLDFISGKTQRLTAYGISVLMAALNCTVNDIFPSIKPSSEERVPEGAEAFRGIGSYWNAMQLVISS